MLIFTHSTRPSFWMAAINVVLGILLALFPSVSVTIFCTGAGIALILYGLFYFFRYWQAKRKQVSPNAELLLGLILVILGLLFLSVPTLIFSILPFMLGALLLVIGLCKLPMVKDAFQAAFSQRYLFLFSALIPLVLGLILLFNPFGVITSLIAFFGVCLIINGVLDILGYFYSRGKLQK